MFSANKGRAGGKYEDFGEKTSHNTQEEIFDRITLKLDRKLGRE